MFSEASEHKMNDNTAEQKIEHDKIFANKANERISKGSTSSNGSVSSFASSSLENQAKEKLALYVYEYLLHQGATRAAQTFLSEIQWEKNISLGEPPGFLHSWWCVFWDLYCAAPERQDPHNHSPEAKAFHDLNSGNLPSPSYIPQPNNDMSSISGMQANYFQFMNNRYSQARTPSMRMPNQGMGPGVNQSPYTSLDPTCQQQASGTYQNATMMNAMRGFNNGMPSVPHTYGHMAQMNNTSLMGVGPIGPSSMQMGPRPAWNTSSSSFGIDNPDPIKIEPHEGLDDIPVECNESAEIQRIKESMKEEVKKFESENNQYYKMH
ncbi:single-stranded DNA-binding protein 2 isoform X2 [Hydra vulgaris]|uniref:Single-stranded DNA-binding protein 2 isoform X5 n=1 Tax=Hydra vulgaris TaxID=6087 RepID=A0ABM4C7H4_HYDVU|nr:single-stranded DNA-binding protein 2-like isoform X2 [Hydra vulgaris]